jgi:predicted alpha/beta superfamily hydrolase
MRIIVHYPHTVGDIVLRTDDDWQADMIAKKVSPDGTVHEFEIELSRSYCYFKPVLLQKGKTYWARGNNYLALRHEHKVRELWPHFLQDDSCSVCELRAIQHPASQTTFHYRVFHPPGYGENTLKKYPVLYLQDGHNVFFRDKPPGSGSGNDWRLEETLTRLAAMNAVDKMLAVSIYPHDRERDYTRPGYKQYGHFLAKTLKPRIDREFRTLRGADQTGIMGSSLGGVASFYTAWQWPQVFGKAACLSTTFGFRDDLEERVGCEAKRDVLFYLDSGWPEDNYEVTRDMRAQLASRGWIEGTDLFYYAFPDAHHNEQSWALRCHIPIQIFFGRLPGSLHRLPGSPH